MKSDKEREGIVRVAVVDDDANIRQGLWWLLNNVVGMTCVGAYATFDETMSGLTTSGADILLLDVGLPRVSGIEAIPRLRQRFPGTRIIMHSNYDDADKIHRSRAAGASGYLLKNASASELYDTILAVRNGDTSWPAGYPVSGTGKASPGSLLRRSLSAMARLLNPSPSD